MAVLVALIVASVATMATSAPNPNVRTTSPAATLSLDSTHASATQLFVVRIPAEAATGLASASVNFQVDSASARGAGGQAVVADEAIRLRVLAVSAEAENGVTPDGKSALQPAPQDQWMIGAAGGEASLPITCRSPGPCERAFRLVATMTSAASEAQITWHLETNVSWYGTAYPSGVGAETRIDAPILVAGPPPALDVATAPEAITLAADHPVVARVVQLHFTIPKGRGSVPAGTVEVVATTDDPTARFATNAATSVYLIPDRASATASQPPIGAADARLLGKADDPFRGCVAGSDCVRTFFVSMSWTNGAERTYTWQFVIHRSDMEQVLAEPPGSLTLRTLGGIEPLAGPPSRLHFEGDSTYGVKDDTQTGRQADIPLRVRLVHGSASSGAGPSTAPGVGSAGSVAQLSALTYAALLPVPGSARYNVAVVGPQPTHTNLSISVRARMPGQSTEQGVTGIWQSGTGMGNPFIACQADTDCPTLTFEGSTSYTSGEQPESINVHWTLDVDVYSYPGLGFVLEKGTEPVASPTPS